MNTKEYFVVAWKNRKLVGGALKAAHVRPDYHLYEDLFQEGLILYAEMLEQLSSEKSRTEIDKLSFKKILWQTLNRLHKEQLHCERNTDVEQAYDLGESKNLDNLVILKNVVMELSEIERLILLEHLIGNSTLKQLSTKHDIPRRSLTRIKHDLIGKLHQILDR
jgi:DNA-directed RNA polymerase specialized sigma subunit